MPLSNEPTMEWSGWLVDNLGGRAEDCQKAIYAAIKKRDIPRVVISFSTVNMWWRKSSRCIDVASTLDGTIVTTIHIEEYGSSLWLGRAIESHAKSNYYKRMAARAFIETIDRCIREAVLTMVDATSIQTVADIDRK